MTDKLGLILVITGLGAALSLAAAQIAGILGQLKGQPVSWFDQRLRAGCIIVLPIVIGLVVLVLLGIL